MPLGLHAPTAIATALAATQSSGYSPTVNTLNAVRSKLVARRAALGANSVPQFVLLLTDGIANCSVDDSITALDEQRSHEDTLTALGGLTRIGVRTYVVGLEVPDELGAIRRIDEYALHGQGGKAVHVAGDAALGGKLKEITETLRDCGYTLSEPLPDRDLSVTLDGKLLTGDDAQGRVSDGVAIALNGAACDSVRNTASPRTLAVTAACDATRDAGAHGPRCPAQVNGSMIDDVLLVVDNSRSMETNGSWEPVKQALKTVTSALQQLREVTDEIRGCSSD